MALSLLQFTTVFTLIYIKVNLPVLDDGNKIITTSIPMCTISFYLSTETFFNVSQRVVVGVQNLGYTRKRSWLCMFEQKIDHFPRIYFDKGSIGNSESYLSKQSYVSNRKSQRIDLAEPLLIGERRHVNAQLIERRVYTAKITTSHKRYSS